MTARRSLGPVLGIETSCDETSAAVVEDGRLCSLVIASQDAHARYGGVVPEIAARAHLRHLDGVVAAALEEAGIAVSGIGAVGVTAGPGLVGALLVGVNWGKAFAFGLNVPVLGVHHMEAHLFANALADPEAGPPFVALLVSGGHTLLLSAQKWGEYTLLGQTRDDAAGEAFDKVARRLGLGYPGGPEIERAALRGKPGRFRLPRPMMSAHKGRRDPDDLDVSFSGLKTAAALLIERIEAEGELRDAVPDVAAEFQAAVIDVLAARVRRAMELTGVRRVLLGGGVSCNRALCERLVEELGAEGRLFVPPARLASDNAAMIARLAEHRLRLGDRSGPDLNADPTLPFPGLRPRRMDGRSPPPASQDTLTKEDAHAS